MILQKKPFLGNFEEEFNIDTSREQIHFIAQFFAKFKTNYTAGKRQIDCSGEKLVKNS